MSDLPATLPPTLPERLAWFRDRVEGRIVFTTSLGIEDQAIAHGIYLSGADIRIATLDTGRLFQETLDVWAQTEAKYGLTIHAAQPDGDAVRALLAEQGPLGFRDSLENRKACCRLRKVVPLRGLLEPADGWVTGIRADQTDNRQNAAFVEQDDGFGVTKFNPILDWTDADVRAYVEANDIPYNALHDKGFPSIGCLPCTRAVMPGEDPRAGRWWWERDTGQECGLHVDENGRLVRKPG